MDSPEFTEIRYDRPGVGVARITLARPDTRNAQDRKMLYQINAALDFAMHDDEVNVVIMAADGPHYSSGHHLHDQSPIGEHGPPVLGVGGYELPGAEGYMAQELEIYLGFCWRWRNLPKPTIAQVQGKVIAGGLMLVWPFDLIVAADNTEFSDPVVAFGVNGHEFFVHAFELGHRKAKELLFTGDSIGAAEAKTLGMVNQVVKLEELERYTLALAEKIAKRPSMGLKLAKMSVNQSLDAQGMWTAVQSAFGLHHLGHTNSLVKHGIRVEPTGVQMIREGARPQKVEFGSDAWLALAERTLKDVVAERRDSIAGEQLTISEVFVDAPTHLCRDGLTEIAWSLQIADGKAVVEPRERTPADYRIRADYNSTLTGARTVYSLDPAEAATRIESRQQAVADGLMQQEGSLDAVSPAMRAVVIELHNRLAVRTA